MKRAVLLALVLVCLPMLAAAQVYAGDPPAAWAQKETLEWTVFDVNEGDAMLLTCGGESMLVDGGPKPFRAMLRDELEARGLRHLTRILNTHYHDDHIDGLYYLFTYGFTADEYLHAYSDSAIAGNKLGRRTVQAAKKNGVPVRRVADGDTLTLGGATIDIIQCTKILNTNARSLVLRVSFGGSSILLCADITGEVQHELVESLSEQALRSDLIKLPHHALTPAVPEFLDAVAPQAAVITNRSYNVGTPAKAQLTSRKIPAYFSGDGLVRAVTDGVDWYMTQQKAGT